MDVPFQSIGMDMVGLLPNRLGKHFVLVICDYATTEVIPLKTDDAEQMAEALITFSSRLGYPVKF